MNFHLETFAATIATGTTPLLQVASIPSQIIPQANSGFLTQSLTKVIMAAMVGTGAIRAQFQAPSLRTNPYIDIVPANRGALFESPVRFADWTMAPLVLTPNQEIDAYATQNGGSNEYITIPIWFADQQVQVQAPQPCLTVHGTSSTTLTAKTWTACTFALDQNLNPGTYALIGVRGFSATGQLIRGVPNNSGQSVWRPGTTMVQAYDGMDLPYARYGRLGTWFTFATTNLPTFEIFATSADTAEEVWLDLIQVSSSVGAN
jgi:hypothetical protein